MSFLIGHESVARVRLLLSLTKISSDDVIEAVYHHLCNGFQVDTAALLSDVEPGSLSRAVKKLSAINDIVEKIKESDWHHINKNS